MSTTVWPRVNKRAKECSRFKATIEYDGANFNGWQRQGGDRLRTIQETMETRLRPVLQQKIKLFPSGRTDAGVSASGQVCQFDAVYDGGLEELRKRMNDALPEDVRVRHLSPADKKFSAMNCSWKRYVYTIPNGDFCTTSRFCRHATLGPRPASKEELDELLAVDVLVDVEAMRDAGRRLVGMHDFAGFQSKGGRSTTVRTMYRCDVEQDDDGKVRFVLEGNGFLYNMVRIVAGTLVQVGVGTRTVESVMDVLRNRDRQTAGPTLAAAGLSLNHVEYGVPHPLSTRGVASCSGNNESSTECKSVVI